MCLRSICGICSSVDPCKRARENGEEQTGGNTAHQDPGKRLDASHQTPVLGQHHVAEPRCGVGDRTEVEGVGERAESAAKFVVKKSPSENLNQMKEYHPGGDLDQEECDPAWCSVDFQEPFLFPQGNHKRQSAGMYAHADSHQTEGGDQVLKHGSVVVDWTKFPSSGGEPGGLPR